MFVAAKMVALAQVRSDRFDSKSVVDFFCSFVCFDRL